jgi:hypothetical protein
MENLTLELALIKINNKITVDPLSKDYKNTELLFTDRRLISCTDFERNTASLKKE